MIQQQMIQQQMRQLQMENMLNNQNTENQTSNEIQLKYIIFYRNDEPKSIQCKDSDKISELIQRYRTLQMIMTIIKNIYI